MTSTAPDGSNWEPSARALLEGGKTLVDHAHLRDSFTWDLIPGGGLEYGSDMIYAAIHQSGGLAGRNHAVELPAREMVPEGDWPSEYLLDIGDIVIDHITRSIQ
jgi:phage gpG-like protein